MSSYPAERRVNADRICIIGAGLSGLVAAKYILAEGKFSCVTILEQRASTGGIWNYVPGDPRAPKDLEIPQTSPQPGHDRPVWAKSSFAKDARLGAEEEPIFVTPMYDQLEANIPRVLMSFSDLSWPNDVSLFPQHARVLEYINEYAAEVQDLIQFRTQVQNLELAPDGQWIVRTRKMLQGDDGEVQEEVYDAVVVASGHFNVPYVPLVSGIHEWNEAYSGAITHSRFYRKPEHYAGKKVIVVGNAASGMDIGAQVQTTCLEPLLVSQKSTSLLNGVQSSTRVDKPEVVEYIVKDRAVRFADDSIESNIDAVIYCTGYFYSFPFISTLEVPVITTGERVENLYQHTFYRPRPSLAFLGLNQKVSPFILAEAQAAVIARVLSGRLTVPSEEAMQAWEQEAIDRIGEGRGFHDLKSPKDVEFFNMLHDWAVTVDGESTEQTDGLHVGKKPPRCGEKDYWLRERFMAIKKAFGEAGEKRHEMKTLESLGFDFERWKREAGAR